MSPSAIDFRKTDLETMIKGISCTLHQAKNSWNPGSSRISVGRKLIKFECGKTTCFSPTSAKYFFTFIKSVSIGDNARQHLLEPIPTRNNPQLCFSQADQKNFYYLKLSNPASILRFPCLLFSFPNPRLSVISKIVRIYHMEGIEDGSHNHLNQMSWSCHPCIPSIEAVSWIFAMNASWYLIINTNQSDKMINFLSSCRGGYGRTLFGTRDSDMGVWVRGTFRDLGNTDAR